MKLPWIVTICLIGVSGIIAISLLLGFPILGLSIIGLFVLLLFIGVIVSLTWIFVLPILFDATNKLSEYSPLIKKNFDLNNECIFEKNDDGCTYGEPFDQKVNNTFWANFGIAFSLYLTLTYIIYAIPTSFFDFSSIGSLNILLWNYIIPQSTTDVEVSYIAFILTFFMIPAFLISLRLLANPTRAWFHKNNNISEDAENARIRSFKDQIISFYFSFIASTIIIFYLSILYLATKFKSSIDIRLLLPFSTSLDLLSYLLMIFLEIIAIYAISYCEEKYFEKFPPIDQNITWRSCYFTPKKFRRFF